MFFIKELVKLFSTGQSKKRIGFKIPALGWYHKVPASTRIRAYDIIKAFDNDEQYRLELYKPLRKYDMVIFLKNYNHAAYQLAQRLKQKGTKVVFDININIFETGSVSVSEKQLEKGDHFARLCDAIITNSPYTLSILQQRFIEKPTYMLNEALSKYYFNVREIKDSDTLTLIWIGYAHKASALLLIKNVLDELHQTIPLKVIIIAEKEPDLSLINVPIEFRTYQHNRITEHLARADIFIAPRDLTDPYNLGHSFTKIGIAMAAGIPVVASPLPSYEPSPALCCSSDEDWVEALKSLHSDLELRNRLISEGRAYCKLHYNLDAVKTQYIGLFKNLLNQQLDS